MSQSLSVPPYFEKSNYAYWKIRMRVFLKSMDERIWISIENGWTVPSTSIADVVIPTDIFTLTKDDLAECN